MKKPINVSVSSRKPMNGCSFLLQTRFKQPRLFPKCRASAGLNSFCYLLYQIILRTKWALWWYRTTPSLKLDCTNDSLYLLVRKTFTTEDNSQVKHLLSKVPSNWKINTITQKNIIYLALRFLHNVYESHSKRKSHLLLINFLNLFYL